MILELPRKVHLFLYLVCLFMMDPSGKQKELQEVPSAGKVTNVHGISGYSWYLGLNSKATVLRKYFF
jgi:hypothetical protein